MIKNRTGQKFGRWTVLAISDERDTNRSVLWLCICDCGNKRLVNSQSLNSGRSKSCGCLKTEVAKEKMTTHGQSYTKTYKSFKMSKRRSAKLLRTPKWADIDKIKEIYENRPFGFEVDHIIPLRGKYVSGLHVENNLQYLISSENKRKGNRI